MYVIIGRNVVPLEGRCDKTCSGTGKIPISTRNQFDEVTLIGKLELFEIIKN
jgi:hypothetical protein